MHMKVTIVCPAIIHSETIPTLGYYFIFINLHKLHIYLFIGFVIIKYITLARMTL